VGLVLSSGQRSADLESVYVCPCGGFALGGRDAITIDDVSTVTGTTKFVDVVVAAMRQVRSELTGATDPHLRTIATDLHAGLLRQLCIHATRWNLPPYALLGRTRARPALGLHYSVAHYYYEQNGDLVPESGSVKAFQVNGHVPEAAVHLPRVSDVQVGRELVEDHGGVA